MARPDVAAAAPTGYVTMTDGVSIAVNVRMPTNHVPGLRYPTVFEMSGYDGGSANGGTLAKDVGVPSGTPVPVDDSRELTDYLDTPSRIMLPMVPLTGVQLGPPLPCGAQEAVRCVAQPG
jgi:hypothetical protein